MIREGEMTEYQRYTPVLRWKQAERNAMRDLDSRARERTTPLIELPESELLGIRRKRQLSPGEYITGMSEQVVETWGSRPVFFDFKLVRSDLTIDGQSPLATLGESILKKGGRPVPVTDPGRSPDYQQSVADLVSKGTGACFRLSANELSGGTPLALNRLLAQFGIDPEAVDLVLDREIVTPHSSFDIALFDHVPHLSHWRSVTLLGGSFPQDLSQWRPGIHTHARIDWIQWRAIVEEGKCARAPAFGDYGTLHPIYFEPKPNCNFSASIRYACGEYWLIMRGEGVRNPDGAGYAQWPANARLLSERPEFAGPMFSEGDRFIYLRGISPSETGNATQWVYAGLSHHLTLTARQILDVRVPEPVRAPDRGNRSLRKR